MKTLLKNITLVQTGLFARTIAKGEVVYLQAKHFDEFGKVRSELHPDLKANKQTNKHLLYPGDILFAAKGSKNFAATYEEGYPPAVASTSFFVLRVRSEFEDKTLPEFLVWYLNHPTSQLLLKGQAIGTSIVSISKSVLEEMEIQIPDIRKQKTILKIAELRSKEEILKQKIEMLREQLIQQQIFSAIK